MGVVYRAHDDRLQRDVAVKVLPAGTLADEPARKRFRAEALALSRLNHPNIATVHDFDSEEGIDFLITELVPGVTLDQRLAAGPLPEKEILHLGVQMAEGLDAAHRQGVIHRDLKPGNLRLTPEDRLKVLDFGLATRMGSADANTVTESMADPGGAAGTLAYMAPEQLKDEKTDTRADLWAAGVVLYEVATGRRPFEGRTASALADQIMHAAAPSPLIWQPKLSPRLAEIILKCLEKDPENRYQSAKELLVDMRRMSLAGAATNAAIPLRRWTRRRRAVTIAGTVAPLLIAAATYFYLGRTPAATPSPITSLAVLPFAVSNSDADSEYLADGITESLISSVSRLPGMQVMARSTVFRYKGREVNPQAVGAELKVGALLLGHMSARQENLDLRTELVDVRLGTQLWSGHYNRKMTDLLRLQEEIAQEIAQALRIRLSEEQRKTLGSSGTSSAEAYQLYLRGRFYHERWSVSGSKLAIDYYQQALAKDPSFALAHAGIANSYAFAYAYVDVAMAEAFQRAKSEANKALELDPNLSEAHAALAEIAFWEWRLPEAEAGFKRAIELNPSNAEARHEYSHYLLTLGRYAESEAQSLKAVELDPVSPAMKLHLAYHYQQARDFLRAEQLYRDLIRTEPDYELAYEDLAATLYSEGKLDEACEAEVQAERLAHRPDDVIAKGRQAYAEGGWPARLRFQLARALADPDTKTQHPITIASHYALLRDREQAVRWVQQAYTVRDPGLLESLTTPPFDFIRSDARILAMRKSIGLPE